MFCPCRFWWTAAAARTTSDLRELGPGALLEVSNVIGRGCAAPVTERVG